MKTNEIRSLNISEKTDLTKWAKLAADVERFEDATLTMKTVIEKGHQLSDEDLNLLSLVYMKSVETRLDTWRNFLK